MTFNNLTKLLGAGLFSTVALFSSNLYPNPSGAEVSISNFPGKTVWSFASLACDETSLIDNPPTYFKNGNTLGIYIYYGGYTNLFVFGVPESAFQSNVNVD